MANNGGLRQDFSRAAGLVGRSAVSNAGASRYYATIAIAFLAVPAIRLSPVDPQTTPTSGFSVETAAGKDWMDTDQHFKVQAAKKAVDLVKTGMTLGLGTGSTANAFIALLAEKIVSEKLDIKCIATSAATRSLANELRIPIDPFDSIDRIDLTVDGADEIAPTLDVLKGGGGALLHEKIVAMASDKVCIIADVSKRVDQLGAFPLPVEIVPFGANATVVMIEAAAGDAGCNGRITLRKKANGQPFVTDGGHWIADCAFGGIPDPELLADVLALIPGVVEHGLFLGVADEAFIAGPDGMTTLRR